MNIPSKAINVTELNCHKNNKVEIIAAVSTDKRTGHAAFWGAEMEIRKPLISPHMELLVNYRTHLCRCWNSAAAVLFRTQAQPEMPALMARPRKKWVKPEVLLGSMVASLKMETERHRPQEAETRVHVSRALPWPPGKGRAEQHMSRKQGSKCPQNVWLDLTTAIIS